jgi:hypothetical protein
MASTYKFIGSVTVGAGGSAAMEFTNIPATYTDLVFKFTARYSGSNAEVVKLTFNNSSSSWSFKYIEAYGSGVSGGTTFDAGA